MKLYASLFAMLVLVLSCAPRRAHAQELAGQVYFSMDEAAHDALVDAYNCGQNKWECGGAIYRREADHKIPYVTFFYSRVETTYHPFSVTITQLGRVAPHGMRLVADFHEHICSPHNRNFSQFFSIPDTIVNVAMHTVGYMLDNCSGLVHRFDPAQDDRDDEEVDMASGRKFYLTIGHISDWIDLNALQRPRKSAEARH